MGLASLYEDILDARGDRGPRFIRKPSPRPHSDRRESVETRVTSDEIRPIPSPRPHSDRRESGKNRRESGKKKNVFIGFFRWFFNFKGDSWKGRILGFVIVVFFLLVLLRLGEDK